MKIRNPLVARFQNEPALVASDKSAWFESCLEGAHTEMTSVRAQAKAAGERMDSDDGNWWGEPGSFQSAIRPYVVRDGILEIPIKGALLHDFPYAFFGYATGYDYIWRAFERGMGDLNVRGIALVVDSPGGMVAGCFECVDKMFAMRGRKPIRGYASESAYSAAYALISIVDPGELTVTRTGGVGSIGVVTSHVDVSEALKQAGWAITFIFAGKHKVDGNPYEALPNDVKARIQARIDGLYSIFVSTVARNRGIDEQSVRDTEALTFSAAEACENGLADKIGALDDSLADFSASLNPDSGDENMADFTQAQLDEAVAAARVEERATATAAGATAAKDRITAILGCENAKDRPTAALAAAIDTDMTAEQANTFLGRLSVETVEADAAADEPTPQAGVRKTIFDAAMGNTANPGLGDAGGDAGGDDAEAPSKADSLFAARGKPRQIPGK